MTKLRIDTKTERNKLKPKKEPYWDKVVKSGFIGFRRSSNGGSWIARFRLASGKQTYQSLGGLEDILETERYDEAKVRARQWFSTLGNNYVGNTIKDIVDAYVKQLKIYKGEVSANETRQRLMKHIPTTLMDIKLSKLKLDDVTEWHNSLVRVSDDKEDIRKSKDSANRVLSMFKAALNYAYKKDIISTDRAWRRVSAFKNVGATRKVFLTDKQIKNLYNSINGAFHDIVKSALLTGARYGEISKATVQDFDPIQGTLFLVGKTGERECYLNVETIRHFKNLSKYKLPNARLHSKDDGTIWKKSDQHRPMVESKASAKLPDDTVFYSLRHTYISKALLAGVHPQVLAENCGTSVKIIERHYGKFLQSDRREMFNRVKLG